VPGVRTFVGLILLACAAVIAFFGVAYHGYKEEYASTPADTLWWAIPWTVATAVLAVLVVGSVFDRTRRPQWSWLALGLALVMALVLAALFVWA
jgi:hypothetical protein